MAFWRTGSLFSSAPSSASNSTSTIGQETVSV